MLQTPKASVEVKELKVDISKDGGTKPNLFVKLHILPIFVHMGERGCSDQSSNLIYEVCLSAGQSSYAIMERTSAPFICEEFSLSCEFGHDRYRLSMFSSRVCVCVYIYMYICKPNIYRKVYFHLYYFEILNC